jgi:hypothetical protein
MTDNVVKLRKSNFETQIELANQCGVDNALIMWLDEDGFVQYIAPPETSIYELAGMCQAVATDLLT